MKKRFIILMFSGLIIFLLVNSILNSRKVMLSSYHFVIHNIDTSISGNLLIYSDVNRIDFYPFWVTQFDSILIGDSVAKDSCDKWLRFYRLNENNEMELISKQEPVMLFGNMFCN